MTSAPPTSPVARWRPAPVARVRSWLGDWVVIGVWIGLLTAVGAVVVPLLELPGVASASVRELLVADVVFALLTVVPWWCYLSVTESSRRRATLGKRWAGLVVADAAGGTAGAGAVWLRNLVKATPWQLAHLGVSRMIYELQLGLGMAFLVASLLLLAACAGPALTGGRGVHDRAVGLRVQRAAWSAAWGAEASATTGRGCTEGRQPRAPGPGAPR